MDMSMEHTLGIVIGRQDALEIRVHGLETALNGQDAKLDKIIETLSEQKGGVKLIAQLAGLAVSVSAVVGAIAVVKGLVWHI